MDGKGHANKPLSGSQQWLRSVAVNRLAKAMRRRRKRELVSGVRVPGTKGKHWQQMVRLSFLN